MCDIAYALMAAMVDKHALADRTAAWVNGATDVPDADSYRERLDAMLIADRDMAQADPALRDFREAMGLAS